MTFNLMHLHWFISASLSHFLHVFLLPEIWSCEPNPFQVSPNFVLMVVRQKGLGSGLATHWHWQKPGCHRLLPPGRPHVSCVSLLEALAVDSVEDSWCFPQQAFGSPYLGEWAPSAHLGRPPTKQVRDKESKIESNTSPSTYISQLSGYVSTN